VSKKTADRITERHTFRFNDWPAIRAKVAELKATGRFTKVTTRRAANFGSTTDVLAYAPVEVEVQLRGFCQVCGGHFSVESGRVALHGYKRPRWGYIVGRCSGSGELPAEKDVTITKAVLASLAPQIDGLIRELAQQGARFAANGTITELPKFGYSHEESQKATAFYKSRHQLVGLQDYEKHLREIVLPRHGQPYLEVAK
jgi:hypothetical protein